MSSPDWLGGPDSGCIWVGGGCTQEPRNQFAGQEFCGLHTLGVLNSGH